MQMLFLLKIIICVSRKAPFSFSPMGEFQFWFLSVYETQNFSPDQTLDEWFDRYHDIIILPYIVYQIKLPVDYDYNRNHNYDHV